MTTTETFARKLALADIADLRAYERERAGFRAEVIALKKRRRVGVGPFVTMVFENRETVRFQIQEMARVEKILSDDGIQNELDIYNPLIPEPGSLRATLFVELTSKEELVTWLPLLVGVEGSVELVIGEGGDSQVVAATPDAEHAKQLTRDEITASVHYVGFDLTAQQVADFADRPVRVRLSHPAYSHETLLTAETRAELLRDLRD
jgi:Protein of unknown function (DUF3501)